jgi:N-acetylneuraminic acid mutarotase
MRSRRPDGESIEEQETRILEKASADVYRDEQSSASRDEALGCLDKALESLPEDYQQVLTLHYLGGMSGQQMSQFLGISHANVRQRLSRARRQLREEVLVMMDTTYEGQRLQAGFTFRIVEAVKRIKINPMPRLAGLPWGLSLTAGIIIIALSLNPHLGIPSGIATSTDSLLPAEAEILETEEILVDVWKIPKASTVSSKQGDYGEESEYLGSQNTMLMSPHRRGDTWTKKADMPTARTEFSTSSANGKIYAIGGFSAAWQTISTVEEYNPETNTWTRKASMSVPRRQLSTSVVSGKIYAIGGKTQEMRSALSTVEEYDPVTDRWNRKSDMPTPRTGLSTSAVNGRIYAIGGRDVAEQALSVVEEYDPVADKWKKKDDMPFPRTCSNSVVNGMIYAMSYAFGTVEEYDPATDTWTGKANVPTTRDFSTSAVNGRVYAIGGCSPNWLPGDPFLSTVEEYDPATDTWIKKADMPTARSCSTSVVNGKIYAIGGYDGNRILSTVEEYDTGFAIEAKGKLPTKWGKIKSD